jgi:hypothetical protein
MKKALACCVAVLVFVGGAIAVPTQLNIWNFNSAAYVVGDDVTGPGLAANGWVVAIYIEDGTTSGFTWGEDDFYAQGTIFDIDSNPGNDVQGVYSFGGDASLAGGETAYGVVFAQTTLPTFGDTFWYAELDGSGFGPVPEGDSTQDFGGDGDWVFVPEPTSMALFALGLVTLVARRKLRK